MPRDRTAEVDPDTHVRLVFDRGINPLTVGAETVHLKQDGVDVAVTVSFGSGGRDVVLAPLVPLKVGQIELTVVGVEDLSGEAFPPLEARFQIRSESRPGTPESGKGDDGGRPKGGARRQLLEFLMRRR